MPKSKKNSRPATQKQIELLLRLWERSGRISMEYQDLLDRQGLAGARPDLLPDRDGSLALYIRSMGVEWASSQIKIANAGLGWEPKKAPATRKQLLYLRDLEIETFGEPRTSLLDKLSYEDADEAIKLARQAKSEIEVPDSVPSDWDGLSREHSFAEDVELQPRADSER